MFNYNNNQYGQNQMSRYNTQGVYGQVPQPSIQQPIQPMPTYTPPVAPVVQGLQGKLVDSIDVVKGAEIPLDGSVSYFALTDGTAIVTKQLQNDGSSKIVIYRPTENPIEEIKQPVYITPEELEVKMKDFSIKEVKDIKDELKSLKREIRDIKDDIKEK